MGEGKRKSKVKSFKEKTALALQEEINTGDILTATKSGTQEEFVECELANNAPPPEQGDQVMLLDRDTGLIEVIKGTNIIGHVTDAGLETLHRIRPSKNRSSRGNIFRAVVEQSNEFGNSFWVLVR